MRQWPTRWWSGIAVAVATASCAHHDEDAVANDSAIVGGLAATEYQEAATIDFTKDGQPFLCSGALIAPKVVLTAGHCVVGATNFLVRAGGFSSFTTSATVFDYTDTTESVNLSQHDIGLVFLGDPITLPRYAAIARGPVESGTVLMNVGRIQNGNITDSLFENSVPVEIPGSDQPFDYSSADVIQPGDSGGPDFIFGTHTIAAVNSGLSSDAGVQSLARVDLLADFIAQEVAAHGGDGASDEPNGRMPGTSGLVVTPGLYGSLALAVHESTLTGSVREGTCEFTIAGRLSGANPMDVLVRNAQTSVDGATLEIVDATTVVFRSPNVFPGCSSVLPQAASGESLTFRAEIQSVVLGFRSVMATRAFFHDSPGSPAGPSFVINGQTVQQLSENEGGFVKVRFTGPTGPTTTGFLQEFDLLPLLVNGTSL
jgi:hypothetical protein